MFASGANTISSRKSTTISPAVDKTAAHSTENIQVACWIGELLLCSQERIHGYSIGSVVIYDTLGEDQVRYANIQLDTTMP